MKMSPSTIGHHHHPPHHYGIIIIIMAFVIFGVLPFKMVIYIITVFCLFPFTFPSIPSQFLSLSSVKPSTVAITIHGR
jgi:hypothetical protein